MPTSAGYPLDAFQMLAYRGPKGTLFAHDALTGTLNVYYNPASPVAPCALLSDTGKSAHLSDCW